MATFVEELIARLALDTDEGSFRKGEKSVKQMNESLTRMAKIGAVAMAAVGAAAGKLVYDFANASVEVDRFAGLANAGTEEFQRFAAGAATAGIDLGKTADILKDVNDRVGDFMTTGAGPMADFFENVAPKVGVTADQFARLSGPEALQLYVDSLEKAGLSQQEMTFYMEAMASDSSLLIPLLRDAGAEMGRLGDAAADTGQILDKEAIAQGRAFKKELGLMGGMLTGVRNIIAIELVPTITDLMKQLREFIKNNREIIKSSIVATVQAAAIAMKALAAAAGLFIAYKIGASVIALTLAMKGFTAASFIARLAALAFNASLLIIPIAIGLAIAAIAVISEDLYTFIQGGDSMIGRFIEKFPKLGAAISFVIDHLKNMMDIVMGLVHLDFSYAAEAFGRVIENWKQALTGFLGWIGEKIPDGVKGLFGMDGTIMQTIQNPKAGTAMPGSAPMLPQSVQQSTVNNSSKTSAPQDNRTITINGADIAEVKRYIGQQNAFSMKTLDTGIDY